MTDETREILVEVERERETQDAQWGGEHHDDEHDEWMWIALLTKHVGRAAPDGNEQWRDRRAFRRQMIRVAALAVAAAEWSDRRVVTAMAGAARANGLQADMEAKA